jgi:hypothetical protein
LIGFHVVVNTPDDFGVYLAGIGRRRGAGFGRSYLVHLDRVIGRARHDVVGSRKEANRIDKVRRAREGTNLGIGGCKSIKLTIYVEGNTRRSRLLPEPCRAVPTRARNVSLRRGNGTRFNVVLVTSQFLQEVS